MGIEDLALALASQQDAQNSIAQENPYLQLQGIPDSIGKIAMQSAASGKSGLGQSALVSGIAGLLSGGLGVAGGNYQRSATEDYTSALADSLAGKTPSIGGLSNSLFADAKKQASLFAAQRAINQMDMNDKYEQEKKLSILSQITKYPEQADEIIAAASKLDGNASPSRSIAPMEAATPSVEVGAQPASEDRRQTMQEKTNEYIKSARKMGMTPNQALEYANKFTKPDELQVRTALKKIEASRQRANTLSELANTAIAGAAGAGETGGIFNKPRNILSNLAAAAGSKDQRNKLTAQAGLDSVRPDLVKIGKSPGAVTEGEGRIAIAAGPNSDQTPEANIMLGKKMLAIADVENDYANFIESYVNKYGDVKGADELWAKYKKENPIFVRDDQTGEYYVNEQRTPITEYDFSGSKPRKTQETPALSNYRSSASSGVDPVLMPEGKPLSFEEFKALRRQGKI